MFNPRFRVWDPITKQMEFFSLKDSGIIENIPADSNIMMSSGLFDKKGKEIYEGDIIYYEQIRTHERDSSGEGRVDEYTCRVIFERASFFLVLSPYVKEHLGDFNLNAWTIKIFEVTGNIYG
jgi:uncharacterized phage protein (TIGR01671 family)